MASNHNEKKPSENSFLKSYGKYIAVVALAAVLILIIVFSGRDKPDKETQSQSVTDVLNLPESEVVTTEESNELRENDIPEIDTLVNAYFTALLNQDVETLSNIMETNDEITLESVQKEGEYIENYQNIRCYVKDGLVEGTYFVIAYYEIKVLNVDTLAPSLIWMYVCTNEDGSLYINKGTVDGEVAAYLEEVQKSDEVNVLAEQVDTALAAAVEQDEKLAQFLNMMREGADPTAVQETEPETEAPTEASSESGEEGQSGEDAVTMYTNANVNVRKTPSVEGELVGKMIGGTAVQRIGIEGDWSKVLYQDQECYIKSEFLSEQMPEGMSGGLEFEYRDEDIIALQGVKIRKEPSTESEELGVLAGGVKAHRTGYNSEWSRIVYEGQTCYVASQYVELDD